MAVWVETNRLFDWRAPNAKGASRQMRTFEVGQHFMTEEQAAEAERLGAGKRMAAPPADKGTDKSGGTKAKARQ